MKNRSTLGWVELIAGIILIIFGVYIFRNPVAGLGGVVAVLGTGAIISGIADIVFYVQMEKRTGFGPSSSLIAGIFSILLGLLLVMNISTGARAVSVLFPFWFILHCISRLANLGLIRLSAGNGAYWTTLLVNTLGLVVAFLLLFNPFASGMTAAYVLGVYLLVQGVGSIVTAFSRLGQNRG